MAYLIICLAIVLLIAGVWLWVSDSSAPNRGRKSWAEANGFSYVKQDTSLVDEWQRGAAATGSAITNVATGNWGGHETVVADVGPTTVVAMSTGAVSDVVVDMRRDDFDAASSEDLVEVAKAGDFAVFGTDAGVAQRFVDKRVRDALDLLPATVVAVWFESEWVLAEVGEGVQPGEWEAAFEPLARLADAARTLPPANPLPLAVPFPTRDIPDAPEPEPKLVVAPVEVEAEAEVEEPLNTPKVQRPEEPLELPTRTTGAVRGPAQEHALGGDEVSAIADGPAETAHNPSDLTRARRTMAPPSIFGSTGNATEMPSPKEPTDE
ncbi:hypothetical protein [Corynebacterium glaucum]|uniref:hypothetical protein n=1 Tax=Corynebacterium glaucum TaxID=187491 RepID=UPI00265A7E9B|nr:hypothetical protein [Corynebacterium glaucum]